MPKFHQELHSALIILATTISLQIFSVNSYSEETGSTISDIYSDIDMRVKLAVKPNTGSCSGPTCEENQTFDARVTSTGRYLAKVAEKLYPQQIKIIQHMTFSVLDKKGAGTASNNKGKIIVFRGIQNLQLSDDALGFIIAREMGHVLAGHHSTNASTKLLISAFASIIFPAAAIIGASSTAAQASTATSLVSSAASTATSMLGGEIAMAKMKPSQLQSADLIAHNIMDKTGWDIRSVISILAQDEPSQNGWMHDLELSRAQLEKEISAADSAIEPIAGDSPEPFSSDIITAP